MIDIRVSCEGAKRDRHDRWPTRFAPFVLNCELRMSNCELRLRFCSIRNSQFAIPRERNEGHPRVRLVREGGVDARVHSSSPDFFQVMSDE